MTVTEPLWKKITDTLRAEIAQGAWPAGTRLPSEALLAKRFDVNRHTVRRALQALSDEGLVHARRGAGVFVRAAPLRYPIGRRTRFRQNLLSAGRSPSRKLLSLTRQAASAAEARALDIAAGAPVHVVEAISLADDLPVSLARSSFCATRLPDLDAGLRALSSVTDALAQAGISYYVRASTHLTGHNANALQARLLEIAVGDALILSEAINIDGSGIPVEFGRTYFVGARVELVLEGPDTPDGVM